MNDETNFYSWLKQFRFLVTPEHPCSYLDDRQAVTLFVDPQGPVNMQNYSRLARMGFRRSGEHIYRPHCDTCHQCKLVRIRVDQFKPNRTQNRLLKKNADIALTWLNAGYSGEHFELYQKYMQHRHPGSSMDNDDPDQYQHIMKADWCETRLAEFRIGRRLAAVAITDWLDDGLSAVYTYFDPEQSQRSLGMFAILNQIAAARAANRDYVYLGYWIKDCDKMSYKIRFNAIEIFDGQQWSPYHETADIDQ